MLLVGHGMEQVLKQYFKNVLYLTDFNKSK